MKWLEIKNKSNSDDIDELFIYGEIGDWWEELDSKSLADKVRATKSDTINVRINSGGGSVFTALSLYSLLKTSGKNIVAHVDGICASAATFLACAASKVVMTVGGQFMIHDPLTGVYGNAETLRETADLLDKVGGSIAMLYKEKTGQDIDDIQEKMKAETWMNANEAKEYGFVTDILETAKLAATAEVINMAGDRFKNMPQNILNNVKSNDKPVNEGGKPMDLTQFKADHSAIADQFKAEILAENKTAQQEAIKAERQRVLDIQDSAFEGQEQLVAEAIENGTDAGAFAIAAAKAYKQAQANKGAEALAKIENDAKALDGVKNTVAEDKPKEPATEEDKLVAALEAEFN